MKIGFLLLNCRTHMKMCLHVDSYRERGWENTFLTGVTFFSSVNMWAKHCRTTSICVALWLNREPFLVHGGGLIEGINRYSMYQTFCYDFVLEADSQFSRKSGFSILCLSMQLTLSPPLHSAFSDPSHSVSLPTAMLPPLCPISGEGSSKWT